MFFGSVGFFRAHRSNTLKHSSLYEAFLPFLSPVLLFILSTTWIVFSPSNILDLQPRIYYLMVGTAFANVTVSIFFLFLSLLSQISWAGCLCKRVCVFSVSWSCVRWVTHAVSRWAGCCCPWLRWSCQPWRGSSPTSPCCYTCGRLLSFSHTYTTAYQW